jgi:hypothetical protein
MPPTVLIVLGNGGVSHIYATAPVNVTFQDYDVEPDSDFADSDNPNRQTVRFPSAEIEIVTPERIASLIADPAEDDVITHCVVCNAELIIGDDDTCKNCRPRTT